MRMRGHRYAVAAVVVGLLLLSAPAAAAPASPAATRAGSPNTVPSIPPGGIQAGEPAPPASTRLVPESPPVPDSLTQSEGNCPAFILSPGAWLECKLKSLAATLINSVMLIPIVVVATFTGSFFPAIDVLFGQTTLLAERGVLRPWTWSLILGGLLFGAALVWEGYKAFRGQTTAQHIASRAKLLFLGLALGAASLFLADLLIVTQNNFWWRLVVKANPGQWKVDATGQLPQYLFARILGGAQVDPTLDASPGPIAAAVALAWAFYGVNPETGDGINAFQGMFADTGNGFLLTLIMLVLLVWLGIIGLIRTLALPVLALIGPAYCFGGALWPTREPLAGYVSILLRAVFVQSLVGAGFVLLSFARQSPIFDAWTTGLLTVVFLYVICRLAWRLFAAPTLAVVMNADLNLGGAQVIAGVGSLSERVGNAMMALGVIRGEPELAARGRKWTGVGEALRSGVEDRGGTIRSLLARNQDAEVPPAGKPQATPVGGQKQSPDSSGGYQGEAAATVAYDLAHDPAGFLRHKVLGHVRRAVAAGPVGQTAGAVKQRVGDALHPWSRRAGDIQARLASPTRYPSVHHMGADGFGRERVRVTLPQDTRATEAIRNALADRLPPGTAANPGGSLTVFGSQEEIGRLVTEAINPYKARLARKVFAWRTPDGLLVVNQGGVPVTKARTDLDVADADLEIVGEWEG